MQEGSSQYNIELPPTTIFINVLAPASINLLGQSATKLSTSKAKLDNVASDLTVLREKCKQDSGKEFYFNVEYYLKEFNRILAVVKQNQPDDFEDFDYIEDVPPGRKAPPGSLSGDQVAKFGEVAASSDKLFARLVTQIGEYAEKVETISILERIFSRFHHIARQLRSRYDSRETIDVSDEYDVQDLLHALLKLYFDDIRPEEWTPSYAGSSSKMDFLLKDEHLVVEVKKSRNTLRDKEIGKQLIEDIAKYKEHPDCRTLVCFIYNPEGLISNPTGLENDLRKSSTDRLDVRVYITPK